MADIRDSGRYEPLSRRMVLLGAAALPLASFPAAALAQSRQLILAPTSLGLRPNPGDREPGTWQAPAALVAAGLPVQLGGARVVALAHPAYEAGTQSFTRIRNGNTIRRFSLELGEAVAAAIAAGAFPIVVGGDCSILLGCLCGARRAGGRGLVHVDGHSDFFHPGNYDVHSRLGSVAGMDLALATGRGETLLTRWPGVDGPLAADADTIQIGERGARAPYFKRLFPDLIASEMRRFLVQNLLRDGVPATVRAAVARLAGRGIDRAWLHVDLDVLDSKDMPAVDSPGRPGLDFRQLGDLLAGLMASGRILGAGVGIYDPERDPQGRYAGPIVAMLGWAFAPRA